MWTSKIGNTAKPLVLSLTNDGTPVSFAALTGPGGSGAPQLRMRQRTEPPSAAVSFDLTAYVDPDGVYNSQKVFSAADFAQLSPGTYIAEVDAYLGGQNVTFPDGGYILLRFLRGVE